MEAMTQSAAAISLPAVGQAAAVEPGRWLQVVSHLDPRYGGISAAVPGLSSAVMKASRASVSIAAFCRRGEEFRPALAEGLAVHYFPEERSRFGGDAQARERFLVEVARASGVHIHGLWQHSTALGAALARAKGKPYLVSAHGMLERWALRNKRFKKLLYAALIERRNLDRAACLHALTEAEAADYRRFGLRKPIAVIPNGVSIPQGVSGERFLERFPALRGQRLILFLSRIHFKKGVDILCRAWAEVSREHRDAHLVLAGPDFEGTRAQVERLCAELGVRTEVTFTGMLQSDLKWSALAAAHAFVLPSYSEGFSVSILEALGMGLPAIVTVPCNLPEVVAEDCGWMVSPAAGELAEALRECLRAPGARLAELGRNGRRLVAERYTWQRVGEQMAGLYGWLESGGSRPSSVRVQGGER